MAVTVIAAGQVAAPAAVDPLLVNPPADTLSKGEDGLFRQLDNTEVLAADPAIKVVAGFTEASNVNSVHELTSMLSLAGNMKCM